MVEGRRQRIEKRLDMERRHLSQAEKQIVTGEMIVTRQRNRLNGGGGGPEEILRSFEHTLKGLYAHRSMIQWTIAECEAELATLAPALQSN